MIDPNAVETFAQFREDIILAALLGDKKTGFYIDIGANYPIIDSVTWFFYQRGWTGINVEPIKQLHEELQDKRPKDTNLQCGVGAEQGVLDFREYSNLPGHSTFNSDQKKGHAKEQYHDYQVPIITLVDIFRTHKPDIVDFIKIDVEGYEYEVVKGNDWSKYRSKVICIESNHVTKDWRPLLKAAKYKEFINDGLNSYYVAEEAWDLTKNFAENVVSLDYQALKQHHYEAWNADVKKIAYLSGELENQKNQIKQKDAELAEFRENLIAVSRLSLKDRSLWERAKRAAYGLTVDWAGYKKSKKK